jgi:hypothetical protein
MRSYIFIIIFLALVKFSSAQVKIKFFNKTGYTVDSLYFQGNYVGQLNKNGELDFNTEVFHTLFQTTSGKIGGMKTEILRNKCGTGNREIKDTTIYLDVFLKNRGKDSYYLQAQYHK